MKPIINDKKAAIKLIIFDIGGVIQGLDWSPVVNSIAHLRTDLDIVKYKEAFYYKRQKNFDLYQTGKMSSEHFWQMVAMKLNLGVKHVEVLSKSFELIYSFVNIELLDLLKSIKDNYKLVVLSNACPEIEKKVIKDNYYTHIFNKIYFSHNIGLKKPNEAAYLKVAQDNRVQPNDCLFIDNDTANVSGASKVGMQSILFKGVESLKKDLYKILEKQG